MEYLCNSCPRQCGVLRGETGRGFCRMGADAVVARAAPHFDEEPVLSGTNGSGAVFFSGCSLRCVFCQNRPISHGGFGRCVPVEGLREIYRSLVAQGVHNINLVNPTHFLEPILASLDRSPGVPVVWNSGGYERRESIRRLEGRVQVYLPDLKYRDVATAGRYSGAPDYFAFASAAIREMLFQTGPVEIGPDGLIRRGVIVRHLVLPGRAEESMRVLDWIGENLPGAWVSLMAQYMPMGEVQGLDELDRRLFPREYRRVVAHMRKIGLTDGFLQELGSAEEKYIPEFDLTGVPESFT